MPKLARLIILAALLATASAPAPQRVWFGPAIAELQLDFPLTEQERRTLPDGIEVFLISGRVTNVSDQTLTMPMVLMVLRNAEERVLYSAEITPPQGKIAPGEEVAIRQAFYDIPASARFAEFGWAPAAH